MTQASLKAFAARLPAGLFASVMGLCGLGLAWRSAAGLLPVPGIVGDAICALAVLVFAVLALGYGAKLVRAPEAARAEFEHPGQNAFIATISISLMLLAGAIQPWSFAVADAVWIAGAGLHLVLAIAIFGRWMVHAAEINHVNPGWFIPIVGNIVAPVTGVPLGHTELSWLFFAVGMMFGIILYAIVFYRLLFHDRLPPVLRPTLFILMAPPAVASLAYLALGGAFDGMARSLFLVALFIALLVAAQGRQFVGIPFAVSWWAYTFPMDALTVAALRYHGGLDHPASLALAVVLLALTTAIVAGVFTLNLRALARGELLR